MKIYAPVQDFNGLRNNVRFVDGVGETEDIGLLDWFKNRGYKVEKSVEKSVEKRDKPIEKSVEKCDEPDFDSMTPNELRDWMKENGLGQKIKNIRNKEKLLEIIRG